MIYTGWFEASDVTFKLRPWEKYLISQSSRFPSVTWEIIRYAQTTVFWRGANETGRVNIA